MIKADNPAIKLKPGLAATISIYILELNDILTAEAQVINFRSGTETLANYNTQHNLSENKKNAITFYKMALVGFSSKAIHISILFYQHY
ncbi:hypothetical protein [Gillisia sp. Hel_I_86]|uniref:hypothetical protein n=1 Tax=Gillisia sp. Hel_I_86 TaxID=1249981 RepID=UPI00119F998E|nr:hypothetical protein [Gillisia sp. Hel_I_86]